MELSVWEASFESMVLHPVFGWSGVAPQREVSAGVAAHTFFSFRWADDGSTRPVLCWGQMVTALVAGTAR